MNAAPVAPPTVTIDRAVIDALLPDLAGHDRSPAAFLVYLVLLTASSRGRIAISHAQLAERAGLSRRAVQNATALLQRRALIEAVRRGATGVSEYRVLQPWRR
jgi:hypothetical protein